MVRVVLRLATVAVCVFSVVGVAEARSQAYPTQAKLQKSMQQHINSGAEARNYKWRYGPITCVAVNTTDVIHTWSCTGAAHIFRFGFVGRKISAAHWAVSTQANGNWYARSVWEFSDTIS